MAQSPTHRTGCSRPPVRHEPTSKPIQTYTYPEQTHKPQPSPPKENRRTPSPDAPCVSGASTPPGRDMRAAARVLTLRPSVT